MVIARLVPDNPVIKPFGVAGLLCGEAAGFVSDFIGLFGDQQANEKD